MPGCAVLPRILVVAALLAGSSGCESYYLSGELKDVKPSEYQRLASPQPVEVVFEFKSDGQTNDAGTSKWAQLVSDTVRESGLFSQVTNEPVASGALLAITLDNTGDDALGKDLGKAAVTGLTFGLVGNTVHFRYVCSVDYQASPHAEHVSHVVRDSILWSNGRVSVPKGAIEVRDRPTAVRTLTRQAVGNALKDLSADPKFGK